MSENNIYYADIRYKDAPASTLERLSKYYTFKDLVLTSYDEHSYAIGFGDEKDGLIIPSLFNKMQLFNVGVLEVDKDINLDLDMVEAIVMDYLVMQTKDYDNPLIGVYEGSSFSRKELNDYIEYDLENNFGKLDKKNDFLSVVKRADGDKRIVCHGVGTELIQKCIALYTQEAKKHIEKQKSVRLDVLNSSTEDIQLRKAIKLELEKYTVEEGLEFLPSKSVADFKRDIQRCIVINYMSTMSILMLLNDALHLSKGPPIMYNQISDHLTYNTLHINFRLLLPREKSMIFNPSTFEFHLLENVSNQDKVLPMYFRSEGNGEEVEKDRLIWADYNTKNPLYFSENYVKEPLTMIDTEDFEVVESLSPLFVYAN